MVIEASVFFSWKYKSSASFSQDFLRRHTPFVESSISARLLGARHSSDKAFCNATLLDIECTCIATCCDFFARIIGK
jgi:hypothetical protein